MTTIPSIDVHELARRLADDNDELIVLDVREAEELAICAIAGAVHIPLMSLPGRVAELPRDRPIACLCHLGMRSGQATAWLRAQGYAACNVDGGIEAWAMAIDPDMPRY